MSERRYSPLATLFAATFLLPDRQRGGGPRASMVRPVSYKERGLGGRHGR